MRKNTQSLQLSAETLKDALWETLQAVKDGNMPPSQGDSVAAQAREIVRIVRVQCQVARESKRSLPVNVIEFSEAS